ncbi:MAG: hypothetical protein ACRDTE_08245 [Pseudonocardiaceae bacterium]
MHPATDTALLSDEEYLTQQSHLEDAHPEATVSKGNTVPGLDDITPPF